MTELRRRMIASMRIRGLSVRTQEVYVRHMRDLAQHYGVSPDKLSKKQLEGYLLQLLDRGLSVSTCRQAVGAMRFFYHQLLGWPSLWLEIPLPKRPQELPEILSRVEVGRICEAPENAKHRLMLTTTYAEGLRVSELTHLRTVDVDVERKTVHVHRGKGARDRVLPLSERLEQQLRDYWKEHPQTYRLFCGSNATRPMHDTTPQRVYQRAKWKAGVHKRGGIHALRHAFATHLLEAGKPLPVIQKLLGHRSISSTMRYLHLKRPLSGEVVSPLDLAQTER